MAAPTSPFQIADFRFYWVARLASTIAQMIMVIVIGWQVYDIARTTMSLKDVKAGRKAGKVASHERVGRKVSAKNLVEGTAVVPGLLKDSISSSKRLKREGDFYRLGITPRGPRVHLYARKIEARSPYMRPGWDVAQAEMEQIFVRAWTKATTPK